MKFIVSSSGLLKHLQQISGVINTNTVLPILEDFLFEIQDKKLTVVATDLETVMRVQMEVESKDLIEYTQVISHEADGLQLLVVFLFLLFIVFFFLSLPTCNPASPTVAHLGRAWQQQQHSFLSIPGSTVGHNIAQPEHAKTRKKRRMLLASSLRAFRGVSAAWRGFARSSRPSPFRPQTDGDRVRAGVCAAVLLFISRMSFYY
jgi:hypothetical protein